LTFGQGFYVPRLLVAGVVTLGACARSATAVRCWSSAVDVEPGFTGGARAETAYRRGDLLGRGDRSRDRRLELFAAFEVEAKDVVVEEQVLVGGAGVVTGGAGAVPHAAHARDGVDHAAFEVE
jgi:hypothetical protein